MELVRKDNIVLHERRISSSEFHAADEVFIFFNEIKFFQIGISLCFLFYFPQYDMLRIMTSSFVGLNVSNQMLFF